MRGAPITPKTKTTKEAKPEANCQECHYLWRPGVEGECALGEYHKDNRGCSDFASVDTPLDKPTRAKGEGVAA